MSVSLDLMQRPSRRERLLRTWHLVVLGLFLIGGLFTLAPESGIVEENLAGLDSMSIKYLHLLLAVRPADSSLKLRLAQALLSLNRIEEAARLIESVPPGDPLSLRARVLRLRLHLMQNAANAQRHAPTQKTGSQTEPQTGPQTEPQHGPQLWHELEKLLTEPLSAAQLAELAAASLSFGRPDLAARIYLRLAELEPAQRVKWLLEGARQALASRQSALAGHIYEELAQGAAGKESARSYALWALSAYNGAGEGAKALGLANRYVERFAGDREILETAARIALANGQPAVAGRYYAEIESLAKDEKQKLHYARLTLFAFTAANQVAAALLHAERYLMMFPKDPELLRGGMRLALGNGQPRRAQTWGRVLLSLEPDNADLLAEQMGIEIAAGDTAMALSLAKRLFSQQPNNLKERERLAQLAAQSGNLRVALLQWAYLALHAGKLNYLERAIKLAPQVYEMELLAALLAKKAQLGQLSEAEIGSLVDAWEGIAEPEKLTRILGSYLERYPQQYAAWEALARVHERRGDLQHALSTFEHISRVFGSDVKESVHRAVLLWQLHEPKSAFLLLRDVLESAEAEKTSELLTRAERSSSAPAPAPAPAHSGRPASHTAKEDFQELLKVFAQLLWFAEPRPESLAEYRTLWREEALIPESAERYINLAKAQGLIDEAIATAETAFTRFSDPEFLLTAMDLAYDNERWRVLDRLLALATEHLELFAGNKQFYLILAEYYAHRGDIERAEAAYRKVIALDPSTVAARVALLWLLIDNSESSERSRRSGRQGRLARQALVRMLTGWQKLAQKEPAMWLPYAAGWAMLGRSAAAASYYGKEWQLRPADHLWLLGYVSMLDALSRSSDARRLRRYALAKLRKGALGAAHAGASKADRALLGAYVELVRDVYGPGKGSRWLASVLRSDLDPEVKRGLFAAWRDSEGASYSYWVRDSRTVARRNPWGRFQKPPKPGQDQEQATLADKSNPASAAAEVGAGTASSAAAEVSPASASASASTPASLRAFEPDASAGEDRIPKNSQLTSIESGVESVNDLLILSTTAAERISRGAFGISGRLGVNQLLLSSSDDPQAAGTEVELSATGLWRHRLGRLELGLGANLRGDANLLMGWLSETFRLGHDSTLRLDGYFNELTSDTRWLRIYGARHRLTLSYYGSLFTNGLLNLQGQFYHYHSRTGEEIGAGFNANVDIGYRIHRVRPLWTVRISASYSRNFLLTDHLPAFGGQSSSAQSIFDALPTEFAFVGLGTRIEHRFPGVAPIGSGRLRYLLDAWLGFMWPANIPGFELHTGIGLGLPQKQELALTGYVSNNLWLGTGTVNAGLGVRYLFR